MFSRSPSRSRSGSRSPSRSRSESRSPSRSRSRSRSPSRSRSRSPCRSLSGSRSRSGRESETLTHRGAGASTMTNSESRAAIEREFRELKRRQAKLMKKKKDIAKKVDKLGDKIERMFDVMDEFERADSLPTALIHFVHQLEKAKLYFQFKERAKQRHNFEHCASPVNVAAMLFRDVELMSYNIEISDINNAATAIYWEPFCKQTQTSQNEPALMDWIYRRVCRVLQGDYVMDKDPEVELKKMMESEPDEYDSYFLLKPANYKKMSKQEAYKKYSELVNIINTGARDSEAFDQNHKVPSTAISSRNKEAVYAKHMVPSTVSGARNKEA